MDQQIREAVNYLRELRDQKAEQIKQQEQNHIEEILSLIRGMEFEVDYYEEDEEDPVTCYLQSTAQGSPLNRLLEGWNFSEIEVDGVIAGTDIVVFYDYVVFSGPLSQLVEFCQKYELKVDSYKILERIMDLEEDDETK